jgi:hypothetical protein
MQIIESTVFGVRSAILRLEASDGAPSFVLFPMIHIAAPEFYAEISRRLNGCDLVLCEGVKSRTSSLLTLSYRFFAENPRLGLVSQKAMKLDHLKGRLIHADVTGDAFESRWWGLKTWVRFVLPLAAPLYGLYMRYFGTRADIARALGMNLRKSHREILASEEYEGVTKVLLDWRDRRLLDVIEQQWLRHKDADLCIAVLFGARHMRAVIRHLIKKRGYRVAKAEWTTVFTL